MLSREPWSGRSEKEATNESSLPHYKKAEENTAQTGHSLNPPIQPEGKTGGKPEGQADKATEEQHAQYRAYPEDHEKEEPMSH